MRESTSTISLENGHTKHIVIISRFIGFGRQLVILHSNPIRLSLGMFLFVCLLGVIFFNSLSSGLLLQASHRSHSDHLDDVLNFFSVQSLSYFILLFFFLLLISIMFIDCLTKNTLLADEKSSMESDGANE